MNRKQAPFRKGQKVVFIVARGEHSLLAGRPGIVEGRNGPHIVVRCTETDTIFSGERYSTPRKNLRHT